MEKIKLKKIIQYLESLDTFQEPKEHLEQYQTTPQVCAEMIHYIYLNTEDFHLKSVIDLGCGNGTLGLASALCGAE
jgi:predicted RNA methylase